MADDEAIVHQLVHGYARGHRLLATSTSLADDVAALVNRASDSAPNYRPSTGPYLTGYSLPDGRWALSRTWPAMDAERPNTVWTHTLLVPAGLVGRVSAAALAALLRHSAYVTASESLAPIPLAALRPERALATRAAARAASAVYRRPAVVVGDLPPDERESVALALWDQHWMPIRRALAFCTAPDVSLFDPTERSLLFSSRPTAREETAALPSIVVEDLCAPTPFREWLHFVGSGERDPSLIDTFALLYLLLHDETAGAGTLRQAEKVLASAGPAISQLRRLKRRLLSFEGHRPRWSVPSDLVLEALAREQLGEMTAADDASLEEWIALAWRINPRHVAHVLAGTRQQPDPVAEDEPEQTTTLRPAKRAVAGVFDQSLTRLVAPATVEPIAAVVPDRLMTVLVDRDDASLWRAWAKLPADLRSATIAGLDERPSSWAAAMKGVRTEPDAVRTLLDVEPRAVAALADELAAAPTERDGDLYPLPDAAGRLLRDEIAGASDPALIRAVSYLASPAQLPKAANWRAWAHALKADRDDMVAAIAYLLGRRAETIDGLELAATALAQLYPVLSTAQAQPIWERLTSQISGDKGTWDRCGRLVEDLSKAVGKQDAATATRLVGIVHRADPRAAIALSEAVRHKRPDGLWQTLADLFRF